MRFILARMTFFLLLSSTCGAGEVGDSLCPSVDLRQTFPMKVRNQGDISWCYAHTAADYLQFFNRIPEQISAADIAITYNGRLWPKILRTIRGDQVAQYGFVRSALGDALDQGYCPETAFPSDAWQRVTTVSPGNVRVEPQVLSLALVQLFQIHARIRSGSVPGVREMPFHFEFEGVSQERFFEVLRDSERGELLSRLRDAACEGRRRPYPRSIERISMRFKSGTAFQRIRNHLETGTPVSIDYFDGVLENRKAFKKNLSSLHTSLLMGQRFDPVGKECQFLIKNSFGESCDGYDSSLNCEQGHLWVGESALRRALVSYVHLIEPTKPRE